MKRARNTVWLWTYALIGVVLAGCSAILPLGPDYRFEGDGGVMDAGATDADTERTDASLDGSTEVPDAQNDAGPCVVTSETCNGLDDDCDTVTDEHPTECVEPGAVTACVASACEIVGCAPGMADCDALADCEMDVSRTRYLCGSCTGACSGTRELCNDTGCAEAAAAWGVTVRTTASHVAAVTGTTDRVFATGWIEGQGRIGATEVDALSGRDAFLVALDDQTGEIDWLHTYGGTDHVEGVGLALGNGHLFTVGNHAAGFDFGPGTVAAGADSKSAHLLGLSVDGVERWFHSFTTSPEAGTSTSRVRVGGIAADSSGNVYIALVFTGRLQRDSTLVASSATCMTHLASFDSDGTPRFAENFEACDVVRDFGIDPTENELHMVGYAESGVVLGGVEYGPDLHGIRAVFDADDGTFLRAFANGRRSRIDESACADEEGYTALAFNPRAIGSPTVYTGIYCPANIDLGLGELAGTGAIVAVHQGAGEAIQSNWRVAPGAQFLKAMSFGGYGTVVVGGETQLVADFGLGALGVNGARDAFLAAYQPDGTVEWAVTIGGPGDETIEDVWLRDDGAVFAAGEFSETFSFGGVTFEASVAGFNRGMVFRLNN